MGPRLRLYALVLVSAAVGYWLRGCRMEGSVTLVSLSPDDVTRVVIVERPTWLDRNFDVRLEDLRTGKFRTVFRSPDEGLRVGSERIVWSADGTRFLLLGRYFLTHQQAKVPHGEQAYLMMDVQTGEMWCNASQKADVPGFGLDDLRAVKWFGWSPP